MSHTVTHVTSYELTVSSAPCMVTSRHREFAGLLQDLLQLLLRDQRRAASTLVTSRDRDVKLLHKMLGNRNAHTCSYICQCIICSCSRCTFCISKAFFLEAHRTNLHIGDACAAAVVSGGGDDDEEEQAHMLLSHDSVVAAARALQQSGVESRRRVGVTQSTRHDRLHVL